ncbi:MAG: hypothetical protein AAGH81_00395 [Bacteroidota bacterium]
MRTILTCFAILFFGLFASAQELQYSDVLIHQKEDVSKVGPTAMKLKKRFMKKRSTTRLYLFKNSRVKKELSFRTKANKAKLV